MDHSRTLGGSFKFTAAQPERIFPIPQFQSQLIKDITLVFWSEQSFPGEFLQTSEIKDLRVYFDGKDITDSICKELIRTLNSADQNTVTTAYKQSLDNWITLLKKRGIVDGPTIDDQISTVKALSNKAWDYFFTKLGNSNAGYRGSLHPLNFIFRDIPIEGISLRNALYPNAKPDDFVFSSVKDYRIIFSHGPSRLFTKNWSPVSVAYEGSLTVYTSTIYHDSWEDEISKKVDQLSDLITSLDDRNQRLVTELDELFLRLNTFETTVTKIENSVNQLSNCLNSKS